MSLVVDATRLFPKLYQGSYPLAPIAPAGFRVLVLCAEELQFRSEEPGVRTLRCPLYDNGEHVFTKSEWIEAVRTARAVADYVAHGWRTLVTCAQGRNRSGLVSALALYQLTGLSGEQCVEHIRNRRVGALSNDDFVAALYALPPKIRQPFHPRRRAPKRIGPIHQVQGVDDIR